MLRKKFADILHKIQQSSSCHQKYRHVLIKLYNESSFDDFECEFMRCTELLFGMEIKQKNIHAERSVEFLSSFVTTLVNSTLKKPGEDLSEDSSEDSDQDVEMHPFLNAVVNNVLQYQNLEQMSARYRCCQFINLLLRQLGDDAQIDMDIANLIQTAMLERIIDVKPNVRLQAVKVLARLQQPDNPDCPVIQAFLHRLYESSAQVRREVVESIALIPSIIPKIVERVRDSDPNVRLAAFRKCSLVGPKMITISNRQLVLDSGFTESNSSVKKFFLEDTLPKWLNVYNDDYLLLLKGLKLDAYEEDLKKTEVISRKVLEVFFKSKSLSLLEHLPIDENKLIPIERLSSETALFWCILAGFLRESDDNEEHLSEIMPELTHFCTFIEKYYNETKRKQLMEWQYLEYQQILCQLLKIVKEYDLSDEVGRQTIQKLLIYMLSDGKFNGCVITEIIFIMQKINPAMDSFTIQICHIVSDIHEPLTEQLPSPKTVYQTQFQLAELRVKINVLIDERDEAVANADYDRASVVKKQLIELNRQVEEINSAMTSQKMERNPRNDPETLCKCLNILIGLLSNPKLTVLTASLRSCKDEFIRPLLSNGDMEVYSKAFKCIALYCLLDKQLAQENLKRICLPIISYRLMPEYDKASLFIAIAAFSDVLRKYGTEIFNDVAENTVMSDTVSKRRLNGTRRLFTNTAKDDVDTSDIDMSGYESIIEILLDMLDDENQELREQSGMALCELVRHGIAVSPTLISRLILKWLNPLTEKHDQKLQQLLANALVFFARFVGDGDELLEKAVIPILTSLGNAPRTSPLADVDIDSALSFIAAITSIQKPVGFNNIHKNLAFAVCEKIAPRPDDKCVPLYVKMLLHLDPVLKDAVVVRELIDQAQLIIDELSDKFAKRNMQKFVHKLSEILADLERETVEPTIENSPLLQVLDTNREETAASEMRPRHSINESNLEPILKDIPTNNNNNLIQAKSNRVVILSNVRVDNILPNTSTFPKPTDESVTTDANVELSQKVNGCLPTPATDQNRVNGAHISNNAYVNMWKQNLLRSDKENDIRDEQTSKKETTNQVRKSLFTGVSNSVKRKKRRTRSSLHHTMHSDSDETILHTIIEDNSPKMGSFHEDDNMSIQSVSSEAPSNGSSLVRRSSRRPQKVIISETSSDSEGHHRKKKALKKTRRFSVNDTAEISTTDSNHSLSIIDSSLISQKTLTSKRPTRKSQRRSGNKLSSGDNSDKDPKSDASFRTEQPSQVQKWQALVMSDSSSDFEKRPERTRLSLRKTMSRFPCDHRTDRTDSVLDGKRRNRKQLVVNLSRISSDFGKKDCGNTTSLQQKISQPHRGIFTSASDYQNTVNVHVNMPQGNLSSSHMENVIGNEGKAKDDSMSQASTSNSGKRKTRRTRSISHEHSQSDGDETILHTIIEDNSPKLHSAIISAVELFWKIGSLHEDDDMSNQSVSSDTPSNASSLVRRSLQRVEKNIVLETSSDSEDQGRKTKKSLTKTRRRSEHSEADISTTDSTDSSTTIERSQTSQKTSSLQRDRRTKPDSTPQGKGHIQKRSVANVGRMSSDAGKKDHGNKTPLRQTIRDETSASDTSSTNTVNAAYTSNKAYVKMWRQNLLLTNNKENEMRNEGTAKDDSTPRVRKSISSRISNSVKRKKRRVRSSRQRTMRNSRKIGSFHEDDDNMSVQSISSETSSNGSSLVRRRVHSDSAMKGKRRIQKQPVVNLTRMSLNPRKRDHCNRTSLRQKTRVQNFNGSSASRTESSECLGANRSLRSFQKTLRNASYFDATSKSRTGSTRRRSQRIMDQTIVISDSESD
ncbi:uncharacterized protein LOC116178001 isoform X4 [Photinus pyralis]|uniref:uncharacterized protein LOC116178001 isoform X4 n=1 Tax=Photinus pyralis TaxID=7054 RepID=UPI00126771A3|nr:uncharacterized protein LOC116178001 isoform X4 [Photinus pyralis]